MRWIALILGLFSFPVLAQDGQHSHSDIQALTDEIAALNTFIDRSLAIQGVGVDPSLLKPVQVVLANDVELNDFLNLPPDQVTGAGCLVSAHDFNSAEVWQIYPDTNPLRLQPCDAKRGAYLMLLVLKVGVAGTDNVSVVGVDVRGVNLAGTVDVQIFRGL